jgi:glutamate--cysteine ligase
MCEQEEGFYQFTQRMSLQHQRYFLDLPLDPAQAQAFDASATSSLARQRDIEAADRIPFDKFLENYFAQQP